MLYKMKINGSEFDTKFTYIFSIKRQKKIFSNGFVSNYTSTYANSKSVDKLLIIKIMI